MRPGKCDQISGYPPVNQVTGTATWSHQALEPDFSWNNVYTPNGHVYGFFSKTPTAILGRDFYNLGAGFPVDTIPDQVKSMYLAARNGVDFTSEYVYSHPLVSGAPTPTPAPAPSATPKSRQHLQKKWKKQAKELKGKKGKKAREKSENKMAEPLVSPP